MRDRWDGLRALLTTNPHDVGCEQTWQLIDVYAALVLAVQDPDRTLPGIAAHLAGCDPCAEDYRGLLHLMRTASEQRV